MARQVYLPEASVVTVAQFHAGTADNIIPATAELVINSRNNSPRVRDVIVQQIEAVVSGICQTNGATFELRTVLSILHVMNDIEQSHFVVDAATKRFSTGQVETIDFMSTIGSEDFAFFLQKTPGCCVFGIGEDKPGLYSSDYNFNDDILPVAAGAFVTIVEDMRA